MHISSKYKVRKVVDENVVLLQGKNPGDMTTVIALNDTALFLWNSLTDKDFEKEDVVKLLTDNYEVEQDTATHDAEQWINDLKGHGIILQ